MNDWRVFVYESSKKNDHLKRCIFVSFVPICLKFWYNILEMLYIQKFFFF